MQKGAGTVGGPLTVPVLTPHCINLKTVETSLFLKMGDWGDCEGPGAAAISRSVCLGVMFVIPSLETLGAALGSTDCGPCSAHGAPIPGNPGLMVADRPRTGVRSCSPREPGQHPSMDILGILSQARLAPPHPGSHPHPPHTPQENHDLSAWSPGAQPARAQVSSKGR